MDSKHVVVIASGETERRAIPHLTAHLEASGIRVEVRIPPRNAALTVDMTVRLIHASWWGFAERPPDKFVVLVDTDGKQPDIVVSSFRREIPERIGSHVHASILYVYAQWHLEAWFFGDARNLRSYLRQSLGGVDDSQPDSIENPKNHLKNLLRPRVYTSRISEEIAQQLDAAIIAERSGSFRRFLEAVMNGTNFSI